VAEALWHLGSPAVALVAVLHDEDWRARQAATASLAEAGTPAVEPLMLAALEDADPRVRRVAAGALGKIGDPQNIGQLVRLTRYVESAEEAVESLQRILRRAASAAIETDLRAVAGLGVVRMYVQESCGGSIRQHVDCSELRQLARQELIRRGLEA